MDASRSYYGASNTDFPQRLWTPSLNLSPIPILASSNEMCSSWYRNNDLHTTCHTAKNPWVITSTVSMVRHQQMDTWASLIFMTPPIYKPRVLHSIPGLLTLLLANSISPNLIIWTKYFLKVHLCTCTHIYRTFYQWIIYLYVKGGKGHAYMIT